MCSNSDTFVKDWFVHKTCVFKFLQVRLCGLVFAGFSMYDVVYCWCYEHITSVFGLQFVLLV